MRMVGTTGTPWQEPSQGCPSCRAGLSPDGDGHPKAERLATAAARMVGAVLPARSASLSRRRACVSSATEGCKGPVLENGTCWVLGGWEDPARLFSTSKAMDKLVLWVEIQTCWSIAVKRWAWESTRRCCCCTGNTHICSLAVGKDSVLVRAGWNGQKTVVQREISVCFGFE